MAPFFDGSVVDSSGEGNVARGERPVILMSSESSISKNPTVPGWGYGMGDARVSKDRTVVCRVSATDSLSEDETAFDEDTADESSAGEGSDDDYNDSNEGANAQRAADNADDIAEGRVEETKAHQANAEEDALKYCANCGRRRSSEVSLKKCGGCGIVRYCSKECSKLDWKASHKGVCGKS
jgi:hypothetical protein